MAATLSISIEGDLQKELEQDFEKYSEEVAGLLAIAVAKMEDAVSVAAPRNKRTNEGGALVQGYTTFRIDDFNYELGSNLKYAPYVEFGTGSKVEIPAGLEAFAREFFVSGQGRQPAQPHFIKNVQREFDDFVDKIQKIVIQ